MNTFNVIGRVSKDIVLEQTKTGKSATKINLAIRNGKDDTTFLTIKVFGVQAENVSKYCTKGSQLAITGTIRNNNYEDDKGNKHYEYSFIGQNIEFLSKSTDSTTEDKNVLNEPKKESKDNTQVYADFGDALEFDEDVGF